MTNRKKVTDRKNLNIPQFSCNNNGFDLFDVQYLMVCRWIAYAEKELYAQANALASEECHSRRERTEKIHYQIENIRFSIETIWNRAAYNMFPQRKKKIFMQM